MWALRILSGPQAGGIIELKMGRNLVGRAPQCDVKITSPGVSKEHSEIVVYSDKIVVTDLKSSNGTYLNGVRMQTGLMRLGDKLGIHDVLVDIIPAPEKRPQVSLPTMPQQQAYPGVPQGMGMPQSMGMPQPMGVAATGEAPEAAPAYHPGGLKALWERLEEYLDRVALPGVYKLPTYLEFRMVLLGFVVLFIFVTTLLAMIPMVQITRASITTESKRRAASIARTLATINQSALLQNSYSSLTTNQAEAEDGVKQVLIIQQSDGMILAPASRAGTTPDLPFVHQARREMRPETVEIDSSTIGASFPIGLFDPNTGEQSVKAHAIVLYDIGSMAFDDGRAISLFMQTLVIASIVGLMVYFFMYKLIEYPLVSLNQQLDAAMREKKDNTSVDFIFPPLQALIGNINSLLTRYIHGEGDGAAGGMGAFVNKDGEAENLVQLIGFPAIAISKDGRIMAGSASFGQIARTDVAQLIGQPFQSIPDGALQQNLDGLMIKTRENTRVIHTDQLEFNGHPCVISCQAMSSQPNDVDYFVITISPAEGGS